MIVLKNKSLCFVCIPKNGTHTIYEHLEHYRGRRIGKYHEYNEKMIPRKLFIKRFYTVMVWRSPVDRAISLYSDIVLREKQNKRKVKNDSSIKIHEYISKNCPEFSVFVDFLCNEDSKVSEYLFKNQHWWYKRINPDLIIDIKDVNKYLENITGHAPLIKHTSKNLVKDIEIEDDDISKIEKIWAPHDHSFKPS